MITRLPNWQLRFEAFVAARRSAPFAWGSNDCAIFAADCVQAITGTDPAPAGLRDHRTAKQALRALKHYGGLVGVASAALGAPMAALRATVGDVVLAKSGNQALLAVCNGTTALAPSANGLMSVGMDTCLLAWRVASCPPQ